MTSWEKIQNPRYEEMKQDKKGGKKAGKK